MAPTPDDTTCPRCGASIAVPETGLNMVCQYCNHEAPVPDLEERREAMEREAAHRRQLEAREQKERHRRERKQADKADHQREKQRNKRERAKQARRRRWGARLATIPGCLMAMVILAVSLAAPAIGLFQAGLFDAFVGNDGSSALASAQSALVASGYTAGSHPQQVRLLGGSGDVPAIELRSDLCYAFSVGSGALITSLDLASPTGSTVASKGERAYGHALIHCPESTGIHQLRVQLDQQFGRYTWAWAWKAKPSSTSPSSSSGRSSSSSSSSSSSVPRAPRASGKRSSRGR
jgi:hypothetical protein